MIIVLNLTKEVVSLKRLLNSCHKNKKTKKNANNCFTAFFFLNIPLSGVKIKRKTVRFYQA